MSTKFKSRIFKLFDDIHILTKTLNAIICDLFSESDYAIITREFEDLVDDKILEAVRAATEVAASAGVVAAAAASENPQTVIL